jgi:Flp pilus assembly pilin Flp
MKNFIKSLWKDESAQGATEYIMLLVVVVGLALLFKEKIKGQVEGLINDLTAKLDLFKQG